ncbi:hypothetical protein [Murimonas intestini]|uniref:Uncharacterized protein n=1 Tax=Murimonas intestini TaxID=1337051 RepID=A0AB73TB03_9FIRM|nr:hypothetical protein [Murimonas intestini]MCR1838806.1 hypothetical protein [Murimonas intestini]MCR1864106.1 hypothetical protein [Murimonas intestini]MCR1881716.1 hypothetical protein [Murimonas intestini]
MRPDDWEDCLPARMAEEQDTDEQYVYVSAEEEAMELRRKAEENAARLKERTAYLTSGYGYESRPAAADCSAPEESGLPGTFSLRLIISAAILGAFIWAHLSDEKVFGLSTVQVTEALAQNTTPEAVAAFLNER